MSINCVPLRKQGGNSPNVRHTMNLGKSSMRCVWLDAYPRLWKNLHKEERNQQNYGSILSKDENNSFQKNFHYNKETTTSSRRSITAPVAHHFIAKTVMKEGLPKESQQDVALHV